MPRLDSKKTQNEFYENAQCGQPGLFVGHSQIKSRFRILSRSISAEDGLAHNQEAVGAIPTSAIV